MRVFVFDQHLAQPVPADVLPPSTRLSSPVKARAFPFPSVRTSTSEEVRPSEFPEHLRYPGIPDPNSESTSCPAALRRSGSAPKFPVQAFSPAFCGKRECLYILTAAIRRVEGGQGVSVLRLSLGVMVREGGTTPSFNAGMYSNGSMWISGCGAGCRPGDCR